MGVIKTNTFWTKVHARIKPSLSINLNVRLSFLFPSQDGKGHEGMTKMAV